MKNLKFGLAFVMISLFTLSFANENSYLILEEEGENFIMYLQINEFNEYCTIKIDSEYLINGEYETFTTIVEGDEIANFENNLARIQEITPNMTIVNFNLTTYCNNGDELSYPTVSLDLDNDKDLAKIE